MNFKQLNILSFSLLIFGISYPDVLAHNIKTDGNVGVTFHLEPDHSPKAKEPSQTWFALTRQGGKSIALSECDCQLKVYRQSVGNKKNLILTPSLFPISAEKYQNIPSANIIFPEVGIYELELTGKAKNDGSFLPFKVVYPVTVTASNKKIEPDSVKIENKTIDRISEKNSNLEQNNSWLIPLLASGSFLFIMTILFLNKKSDRS